MKQNSEKRKYRRFEIPDGRIRYKNTGASMFKKFSKDYPLLNVSLGGAQILCDREFRNGEEVVLQIHAPKEKAVKLISKVVWQNPVALTNDKVVAFEFIPFGEGEYMNSPETMNVLRRLYARYVEN
jgi:Tfp pilus assembly protein PilZ